MMMKTSCNYAVTRMTLWILQVLRCAVVDLSYCNKLSSLNVYMGYMFHQILSDWSIWGWQCHISRTCSIYLEECRHKTVVQMMVNFHRKFIPALFQSSWHIYQCKLHLNWELYHRKAFQTKRIVLFIGKHILTSCT